MRFWTLILLAVFVASAQAATQTAASASYTDVNAARALCASGDTLAIPAGTNDWGANTLTITKPIYIQGAGTNLAGANCTFIYGGPASQMMTWSVDADSKLRLTSLVLSNYGAVPTVDLRGTNVSGGNFKMTQFRVDHCLFLSGKRAVYPRGWCYGVIDHNTFVNCDISIAPEGDDSNSWARAITPGTTNAVVSEDNFIRMNSSSLNEAWYHQDGARATIRFNTLVHTAVDTAYVFDSHGNFSGGGVVNPDSAGALNIRGQPLIEYYGNTIAVQTAAQFSFIRGGSMLGFSNTFTAVTGTPTVWRLSEEESWQTDIFSPLRTVWPAADQITNTFLWSNTLNGSAVTSANVVLGNANDAPFIQENRDWWESKPDGSNGAPAGVYASYTPLTYPHPLVTFYDGSGGGTTVVGAKLSPNAKVRVKGTVKIR